MLRFIANSSYLTSLDVSTKPETIQFAFIAQYRGPLSREGVWSQRQGFKDLTRMHDLYLQKTG